MQSYDVMCVRILVRMTKKKKKNLTIILRKEMPKFQEYSLPLMVARSSVSNLVSLLPFIFETVSQVS